MVLGGGELFHPGDLGSKYLNAQFFAQEKARNHLTPQMEKVVQDLMKEFEGDVKQIGKGLEDLLNQPDVSVGTINKEMRETQGVINGKASAFLDTLKAQLTTTAGPGYSGDIEQILSDVRQQIQSFTDLSEKVPAFAGKKQTVFDLPKTTQKEALPPNIKASPPPVQPYINNLEHYAEKLPEGAEKAFLLQVADFLESQAKGNPSMTLREAIQLMTTEFYHGYGPNSNLDVYMQYGITDGCTKALSDIFSNAHERLSIPPYTQMDQKLTEIENWLAKNQSPDEKLAAAIVAEIGSLGSADVNLGKLTAWAQNLINTSDPLYANASKAAQLEFQTLTGATPSHNPLRGDINALEQYIKTLPDNATRAFLEQVLGSLQTYIGSHPAATLSEADAFIKANFYHNYGPHLNFDVYMQYGITDGCTKALSGIFSDGGTKLEIPPYTQMDQKLAAVENWLSQNLSPEDEKLANALEAEIGVLGSSDANLAKLTAWAQNLINTSDPLYTQASKSAQLEFQTLTVGQK